MTFPLLVAINLKERMDKGQDPEQPNRHIEGRLKKVNNIQHF